MTDEKTPDTDDTWPLRRHHGWRPEPAMGELLRYSTEPDMLAGAEVALWAYDTIRELAGMVRALGGQPVFTTTNTTVTSHVIDVAGATVSAESLRLLVRLARVALDGGSFPDDLSGLGVEQAINEAADVAAELDQA